MCINTTDGGESLVRSRGSLILAVISSLGRRRVSRRRSGRSVRRDHSDARRCSGRNDRRRRGRGASRVTSSGQASARGADAGFNEVLEPRAGVELAVDGVDEPGVLGAVGVGDDFHADQADDGLGLGDGRGVGSQPADDDGVAGVPELEALEVDGRLLALADLELLKAGESRGEQREGLRSIALRAGVDQGVDGLGVVGEVGGEDGIGERVAVANDQGGVGCGDLIGLSIGYTLATAGAELLCWCGDGAESSKGEEDEGADGRHFVGVEKLCGWNDRKAGATVDCFV